MTRLPPRLRSAEPSAPATTPSAGRGSHAEIDRLREQIQDLREALDAIRAGGVDAVVMDGPDGTQIYTLSNADRPYRILVEEMGEGAATISARGVLLYANRRLTQLLGGDRAAVLGRDITELAAEADRDRLRELLTVPAGETSLAEFDLVAGTGVRVPVLASVTGLQIEGTMVRCIVVADLTERRRAERELAEVNAARLRAKTELVEETQRVAHLGDWLWDRATDRMELSPQMSVIFMLDRDDRPRTFCGVLTALAHPADVVALTAARDRLLRDGSTFEVTHRLLAPDGRTRHVLVRGQATTDGKGTVTGIRGTAQDISVLIEVEQALARSAAQFAAAFERNPLGMALAGPDQRIMRANEALSRITGYSLEQLAGLPLHSLLEPDDRQAAVDQFRDLLLGHGDGFRLERRLVTAAGRHRWVRLDVAPVRDGHADGYVVVHVEDISDRRVREDRLHYLADHDPLTGLLNRRAFRDRLDHHLSLVSRYGTGGALTLLDLDNFKCINDTLGHPAGDAFLQYVTRAMEQRLRDSDVLARLGGDEFAVLLWGVDAAGAVKATEDLLAAVRVTRPDSPDPGLRSSASAGVVVFGDGTASADEVLAQADLAMYAAKDATGDRLVVYGPGCIDHPDPAGS